MSGQCLLFSDEKFEFRDYEDSREDKLGSRDLGAESSCVMETCKTGQRPAPGSRSLCTGVEGDPGLEGMPEVLSLPDSSRDGEEMCSLGTAISQKSPRRDGAQDKRHFPSAMHTGCYVLLSP